MTAGPCAVQLLGELALGRGPSLAQKFRPNSIQRRAASTLSGRSALDSLRLLSGHACARHCLSRGRLHRPKPRRRRAVDCCRPAAVVPSCVAAHLRGCVPCVPGSLHGWVGADAISKSHGA
ncbi:hypothetical protein EJB05_08092, partial [Eragrostis curvula]